MSIKAILFDHDGTLVDSEPVHFQIWLAILQEHGAVFDEAHYQRHFVGLPSLVNAQDAVAHFKLQADAQALADEKERSTQLHVGRHGFPLMPGARASIDALKQLGLKLAVVTGAGRRLVEASMRAHALHPLFDTVVSADDVAQTKPAPDCYLLAMQQLGVKPHECLAVEDSVAGVLAATAAGIECLALPSELSAGEDFSRACGRFSTLDEATRWISGRCGLPA